MMRLTEATDKRRDEEDEPTRTDKEDERTSNGYRTKTKRN